MKSIKCQIIIKIVDNRYSGRPKLNSMNPFRAITYAPSHKLVMLCHSVGCCVEVVWYTSGPQLLWLSHSIFLWDFTFYFHHSTPLLTCLHSDLGHVDMFYCGVLREFSIVMWPSWVHIFTQNSKTPSIRMFDLIRKVRELVILNSCSELKMFFLYLLFSSFPRTILKTERLC